MEFRATGLGHLAWPVHTPNRKSWYYKGFGSLISRILGKGSLCLMAAKAFKNFIGGEWVDSRSGQTYENLNPADTRDVIGVFQRSDKRDVDDAVSAARQAFDRWRLVPAPRRAEI